MQQHTQIKFKNYTPQTNLLDDMYVIEKAEPGSISHLIEDKLNLINDDTPVKDLLEPKKIDWDLKRRIEGPLERLERETRKCVDKQVKAMRTKPK